MKGMVYSEKKMKSMHIFCGESAVLLIVKVSG
jgi:hypothetical protein